MWFVPHLSLNKLVQAMCMESNKLTTKVRKNDILLGYAESLFGLSRSAKFNPEVHNDCFPESSSKDIQPKIITCILFHSCGNYYVMSEYQQFSTISVTGLYQRLFYLSVLVDIGCIAVHAMRISPNFTFRITFAIISGSLKVNL